jgi:hypothetical protein
MVTSVNQQNLKMNNTKSEEHSTGDSTWKKATETQESVNTPQS